MVESTKPAPIEPKGEGALAQWIEQEISKDPGAAVSDSILATCRDAIAVDPPEWLRISSVFRKHGVLRAVQTAIHGLEQSEKSKATGDERPSIVISTDERRIANRAIEVLASRDDLWQRGGLLSLVITVPTEDGPLLRIAPAPSSQIRSMMSDCIAWHKQDKHGELTVAHPPDWCVRDVHERSEWPHVRRLLAVTETPQLRADGSILDKPGYDAASGIVLRPSARYVLIGDPDRDAANRAALQLLTVVKDFPFRSEPHALSWLAGVLTPLARNAFQGPVPMIVFDANTRGSGKSLLADITAAIVTGRPMARMSQAKDEDEERKRITAIALQGDPLVLIDNLTRALGSGALDAALTSTVWAERILGRNERPTLPLRACWYATGNNVALRGDTSRRCLHVRLESPLENPEDRSDFAQPALLAWVTSNRAALVGHALTMLRAFCVAGRPDQKLRAWGSFQPWSDLIRGCIVWSGGADPGETRIELRAAADTDAAALPALLDGIEAMAEAIGEPLGASRRGITAGKMARVLVAAEGGSWETLREAIESIGCKLTSASIGRRLRVFKLRVVGGRALDAVLINNTSYWTVISDKATKT